MPTWDEVTQGGTRLPFQNGRAALGAVARDSNMQRRGINQVKLGALLLGGGLAAPAVFGGAGAAGAGGAATAGSTAGAGAGVGAGGAGGVMGTLGKVGGMLQTARGLPVVGGILDGIGKAGDYAMNHADGILAGLAGVEGVRALRESGQLRDAALGRARGEYAERAPLRQMAITGLQNESLEDLSGIFADAGNPYAARPAAPAGPPRMEPPMPGGPKPSPMKRPLPVAGAPWGAGPSRRV